MSIQINLRLDVRIAKQNQSLFQKIANFFKNEEVAHGKEITLVIDESVIRTARKVIENFYPSEAYSFKSFLSKVSNTLGTYGISRTKSYSFCLHLLKETQLLKDLEVVVPNQDLSQEELDKFCYVALLADMFDKKHDFNYQNHKEADKKKDWNEKKIKALVSEEDMKAVEKSIFENLILMIAEAIK